MYKRQFFRRTDVRSLADLEAVLDEAADRHGRLDVLVNNAAVAVGGSVGEMAEEDWEAGFGKSVAVFLNGDGIPDRNARGERVTDDSFVLIFNAHDGSIDFTLPAEEYGKKWEVVLDTATPQLAEPAGAEAQSTVTVEARSLAVLRKAD